MFDRDEEPEGETLEELDGDEWVEILRSSSVADLVRLREELAAARIDFEVGDEEVEIGEMAQPMEGFGRHYTLWVAAADADRALRVVERLGIEDEASGDLFAEQQPRPWVGVLLRVRARLLLALVVLGFVAFVVLMVREGRP